MRKLENRIMEGLLVIALIAGIVFWSLVVVGLVKAAEVEIEKPAKNFEALILGNWQWEGEIDKQYLRIVFQFLPIEPKPTGSGYGTMKVSIVASDSQGILFTLFQEVSYAIKEDKLLTFSASGQEWGLSKIVDINNKNLSLEEIEDHLGKVPPNLITFHRVIY